MTFYMVQPLTDFTIFTTPKEKRKPIRFSNETTWGQTSRLLERELAHLKAKDVVLELAVEPRHIRSDGMLRSDVRKDLPHPGVRLSFQSVHGDLSFTCDTYAARYFGQMADWQANVRAIALSLEALRAVDRYGALKGEQYVGTRKAIESRMGPDAATEVIMRYAGSSNADTVVDELYRVARRKVHPDRNDGDRRAWDQVEAAARVLGLSA